MDLPRLFALTKHWRANPPTHVQLGNIAAGLGTWKPPSGDGDAPASPEMSFDFLNAALGAGGVFTGKTPGALGEG